MLAVDSLSTDARLAPRECPPGRPAGYHRWHELLFLHWRVPSEVLRPFVPPPLELDVWESDAWLGLVAFHMSGIRPWWFPPLPGVSAFPETNLRTYVHLRGGSPGVLFLSLDAAHRLAVRVARWRWRLPYYLAKMNVRRDGRRIEYQSCRANQTAPAETYLVAEIAPEGGRLAPFHARLGTLEFFLAERYIMYVPDNSAGVNRLWQGTVHHPPYPLTHANPLRVQETLTAAAGLNIPGPPCHAMFSEGVNVKVFSLKPIA